MPLVLSLIVSMGLLQLSIVVRNFVRRSAAPRFDALRVLRVSVVDVSSYARAVLIAVIPLRSLLAFCVLDAFDGRCDAIHPPAVHIHAYAAEDRPADLIAGSNRSMRE